MFTLLNMLKAVLVFLREMWLQDKSVKQYVQENRGVMVVFLGFLTMAVLFFYVYTMAVARDRSLAVLSAEHKSLQEHVTYLENQQDGRTAYYRNLYHETDQQLTTLRQEFERYQREHPPTGVVTGSRCVQPAVRPELLHRLEQLNR